jgi:ribosomal protein L11 methyltransferase
MAFGTGTHPTTQLCLELIETVFDDQSKFKTPSAVIDVGCGSGILSVAALRLGSDIALGVDIDEASVKNSRENADNNDIPVEKFLIGLGSVQQVKSGQFAFSQAPLVLANILAPVLIRLFDAGLADLIAPAGAIILSGILEHQANDVVAAGEKYGLKLIDRRQINDWVALLMQIL